MNFAKMTTSQMIDFLQAYEHGGASGKPYDLIGLKSTGDGLVTNISIQLENSKQLKRRSEKRSI